jgi:hypothetical protein
MIEFLFHLVCFTFQLFATFAFFCIGLNIETTAFFGCFWAGAFAAFHFLRLFELVRKLNFFGKK